MSLKQTNNELANLVGASVAIVLAVPIAAWTGSLFGDTYQARATAYILILAWAILGAVLLWFVTRNSTKPMTVFSIVLWVISIWLWPLLLAPKLLFKKNR